MAVQHGNNELGGASINTLDDELAEARQRSAERHKRLPNPAKVIALNGDLYRELSGKKSGLARYGLTQAKYDEMVEEQGSACAICETHVEYAPALAVDHCHRTGAVRGLLCRDCNIALGFLKDDPKRLASALHYVLKHAALVRISPILLNGVSA